MLFSNFFFSVNCSQTVVSLGMIQKLLLSIGLLVFSLNQAIAEYETTRLFAKGYWSVDLTYNTESGGFWCAAKTSNRSGQEFIITAYDSGNATVFVFDYNWSLTKRPVHFLIDIDYSRWTIEGNANDISVSVALNDGGKAGKFISELAAGSAVAIFNADERRLATFSLRGSKAALTQLASCWRKISDTDPFQTSTDPF